MNKCILDSDQQWLLASQKERRANIKHLLMEVNSKYAVVKTKQKTLHLIKNLTTDLQDI